MSIRQTFEFLSIDDLERFGFSQDELAECKRHGVVNTLCDLYDTVCYPGCKELSDYRYTWHADLCIEKLIENHVISRRGFEDIRRTSAVSALYDKLFERMLPTEPWTPYASLIETNWETTIDGGYERVDEVLEENLSQRQAAVIKHTYGFGPHGIAYDVEDTAKMLELSKAQVKGAIYAGIAKLRQPKYYSQLPTLGYLEDATKQQTQKLVDFVVGGPEAVERRFSDFLSPEELRQARREAYLELYNHRRDHLDKLLNLVRGWGRGDLVTCIARARQMCHAVMEQPDVERLKGYFQERDSEGRLVAF